MSSLTERKILISDSLPDRYGAEGVWAIIRNDFSVDSTGEPIYDREFSYRMGKVFFSMHLYPVKLGVVSSVAAETAARHELSEWRRGKVPPETMVRRQDMWEMTYYRDPYLQHLTTDEFNERFADIQNNLLTLTPNRKIGFVSPNEEGEYFMVALTHVFCESGLRGGFTGDWKSKIRFPDYDWIGIDKVIPIVEKLKLKSGKFLVKYGGAKWLKNLYDHGELRITPASFYKDSSLNRAIRDDELELSIKPHFRTQKNKTLNDLEYQLKSQIPNMGGGIQVLKASTDYFVSCFGSDFSLRMFPDFEADGCLIITDPGVFLTRVLAALVNRFVGWTTFGTAVNYIDPVNVQRSEIEIFFAKNFRYAYQKEYRIISKPPEPSFDLEPINLILGSLHDCCHFIDLRAL